MKLARLSPKLALAAAALVAAACHGPAPTISSVEFQTERGIVRGVSTEDGILALVDVVPSTGELSFRYHTGNGFFDDVARLDRKNDALAVMQPVTSRPSLARFGAYPAARDDTLYIEVNEGRKPELVEFELFEGGQHGDLLVLKKKGGDPLAIAQIYAGTGVYAWRNEEMELVGVLNGVVCEEMNAIAFIGLDEIADVLPRESNYFLRRVQPRRADFEYGIPRDFAGEKPFASDAPRPETPPPAPPPKPVE